MGLDWQAWKLLGGNFFLGCRDDLEKAWLITFCIGSTPCAWLGGYRCGLRGVHTLVRALKAKVFSEDSKLFSRKVFRITVKNVFTLRYEWIYSPRWLKMVFAKRGGRVYQTHSPFLKTPGSDWEKGNDLFLRRIWGFWKKEAWFLQKACLVLTSYQQFVDN